MTRNRIKKLQILIEESRGRLLRTHPLFAFLLMHLSFVADNGIKKISTNGKCIFFNPDFLQRLAPN